MREDTRAKIIAAGAAVIHKRGFAAAGIQEILAASGVPKGSFYHFFKSKDAFGLEVIASHTERMVEEAHAILTDPGRSPLENLRAYFENRIEHQRRRDCCQGCPLGNLAQEMADAHPAFQEKLAGALARIERCFADLLFQAREAGEIPRDLDPIETAGFLMGCWQGALIRMKVAGGPKPLETCRDFIFSRILR